MILAYPHNLLHCIHNESWNWEWNDSALLSRRKWCPPYLSRVELVEQKIASINAVKQRVLQMQNVSRRGRGNIAHGWRWYNWLCGIALCVLYVCGSWFCRVVHIFTLFIVMLSYMGCWIYWLLCLQLVWDTKKQHQHVVAGTWLWVLTNDGVSSHSPQVWRLSFNGIYIHLTIIGRYVVWHDRWDKHLCLKCSSFTLSMGKTMM